MVRVAFSPSDILDTSALPRMPSSQPKSREIDGQFKRSATGNTPNIPLPLGALQTPSQPGRRNIKWAHLPLMTRPTPIGVLRSPRPTDESNLNMTLRQTSHHHTGPSLDRPSLRGDTTYVSMELLTVFLSCLWHFRHRASLCDIRI